MHDAYASLTMRRYDPITRLDWRHNPAATLLRLPVQGYGYTLSALMGRWCRHLPTCSEYMDEALRRHGAWPGLWMGAARLCRCRPGPGGTSGFDPVPERLPPRANMAMPWRYGRWASTEPAPQPLPAPARSDSDEAIRKRSPP